MAGKKEPSAMEIAGTMHWAEALTHEMVSAYLLQIARGECKLPELQRTLLLREAASRLWPGGNASS